MVSAMDEAVGNVTQALKDAGMYDNTIIFFTADVNDFSKSFERLLFKVIFVPPARMEDRHCLEATTIP